MKTKSLILIFIALGCGLVASIGISQVMESRGGQAPAVEMSPILVTLTDVDIGAKLDAKNVKLEEWPKSKIPEGVMTSLDQLEDKFARTRFYKGEALLVSKVMSSSDGPDVGTKIPSGFRAMPVKLEQDTVIGHIQPGDKVDVMAFFRRTQEINFTGTITILKNVRVFTVGSNVERTIDKDGKQIEAKTVSLLLKQDQAEKLTMAAEMAKIRLTLRPPGEKEDTVEDSKTTWEDVFNNRGSSGTPTHQSAAANVGTTDNSNAGNLIEYLKSSTPTVAPAPTPPAPVATNDTAGKFQMQIITPTEMKRFEWQGSRNDLPVELVPESASVAEPASSGYGPTPGYAPAPDVPPPTNGARQ